MNCKPAKQRSRLPARPSLLGGGLLERARSTTLALLGVTAAVGLGMVALALNQSWPLIAGSPVPEPPTGDVSVDEARVAATDDARRRRGAATPAEAEPVRAHGRGGDAPESAEPAVGEAPSDSDQFVAVSKPVASEHSPPSREDSGPTPTEPSPQPEPTGSPRPDPTPAVSAPVGDAAEPPSATPSSAPQEESFVPTWSQGNGHAYGRGADRDDDRGGWHGGGHGSHGRD